MKYETWGWRGGCTGGGEGRVAFKGLTSCVNIITLSLLSRSVFLFAYFPAVSFLGCDAFALSEQRDLRQVPAPKLIMQNLTRVLPLRVTPSNSTWVIHRLSINLFIVPIVRAVVGGFVRD